MRFPLALSCAALAVCAASLQAAPAEASVQVGVLRCDVSAGLGMIITSSKSMRCAFRSTHGHTDRYVGTIRKFGLDIGRTERGVLVWDVLSSTTGPQRGALAGDYVGVSASATAGVGGGANALVGGSGRSFTLQPLSGQAQRGVSLAAGVASLTLRPVR
ncbi:DUF992 domain-containing protein [Labrys monachus]|uniref:DUF992 domain-containing protein n=1 Tax=Labrys monachus TaxID=217067 RepID=A0ABU0F976_9HYPH|nr:DUF992 domain-containing protein [Labrys monachus]MDQ0391164.1 hypothetical protein [Labrys monachus]